jgi:hypothetical protein
VRPQCVQVGGWTTAIWAWSAAYVGKPTVSADEDVTSFPSLVVPSEGTHIVQE